MRDIIEWLIKIEDMANKTYILAATYFSGNQRMVDFLLQSAEDEAWHYHVMASAAEHDRKKTLPVSIVAVGDDIKNRIEQLFQDIHKKIINQSLTEIDMLEAIVSTEFSEWNDLFLYVVNSLKQESHEFRYAVARIQNHLRQIGNYIDSTEYAEKLNKSINNLPPIWTENILIVDDEELILDLLKAILNKEGNIDIALNGQEGLRKLNEKYYKLIISDVDMPVMDGLTFYTKASEIYPHINSRFLFITGNPSSERIGFFKRNQLKYLYKPSPINVIRAESLGILMSLLK